MEQRRYPRCKVDAAMRAWSIASDAAQAVHGHCSNLSEGGAGVIIAAPWQRGQVVTLHLNLSDVEDVVVEARLAHRSRMYCGFEFLGASERVMTQVRTACAGS